MAAKPAKPASSCDRVLARLRQICMALPEAREKLSHGEPTWFAGKGKVFAMLDDHHHGAAHLSVWLPQPFGAQEALIGSDPKRFFRPPYVGVSGWVGVLLDTRPDWDAVASLVRDAYLTVATAKLRKLALNPKGGALMPKKLRIDLEQLRWARDDHSGQISWVLDSETGEVLPLTEDAELPVPIEEIEEDETGRFLEIDPEDSHEAHRDMEEFIATVADSQLRRRLETAIRGKGAFRYFKDTLGENPPERERWFRFQAELVRKRDRAWLAENGIEPIEG